MNTTHHEISLMISAVTAAPGPQTADAIADCLFELHQEIGRLQVQVRALELQARPFKTFGSVGFRARQARLAKAVADHVTNTRKKTLPAESRGNRRGSGNENPQAPMVSARE